MVSVFEQTSHFLTLRNVISVYLREVSSKHKKKNQ
jgi:hypothetical protein